MVKKQAASKRMTLHKKYKIQRKVREHNRKERKEARKNPLKGSKNRKGLKKDPGLPNLWPFKEEFLQKVQNQKAKIEQEQERQREQRREEAQKRRNLESLAQDASSRQEEFEKKQEQLPTEEARASIFNVRDGSKKAYFREFKKLLEVADVILEVLDARDPLGSRCHEIEQAIMKKDSNKKIILILNKIDLVPKENVEKWLKYLRNDYPTVAFKATTQEQRKHLNQSGISTDLASKSLLQSSECLGADILIQLLKNYCRNLNLKTSISVGIIGYPNVGKSSLINSLKRVKAVGVGATPGFTKTLQEVYLDKNVKLIDCPGIVFASGNNDNDIILRNCVKIEQIPDPIEPVEIILKRCKPEQLMQLYKIAAFKTTNEFLMHIAKKKGKLAKGGVPDMNATAKTILQDWTSGRIPFFTVPPVKKNVHVSAQIVPSWGKEFDLENLLQQEQSIISSLPSMTDVDTLEMVPGTSSVAAGFYDDKAMEDDDEEEEGEDEMEDEDEEDDFNDETASVMSDISDLNSREMPEVKPKKTNKQRLSEAEDFLNPQINQQRKKKQKQLKKLNKKTISKYGSAMMNGDDEDLDVEDDIKPVSSKKKAISSKKEDDNYNFATDYYDKSGNKKFLDDDIDIEDV